MFGGAWGGLLSGGIVVCQAGDNHYLPLLTGAILGGLLGGSLTALVTHGNLGERARDAGDEGRASKAAHPGGLK